MEFAPQSLDVWHDRAVFHFLTEKAQRERYVQQVLHAVKPNGHVIMATFGTEGPKQCSGLEVMLIATVYIMNLVRPFAYSTA